MGFFIILKTSIKLQQKLNYDFDYFFGKLIFIYELNKLYLEKQNARFTRHPSEIMFPFEPKTKIGTSCISRGYQYLIKKHKGFTINFETIELDHINIKRYIKGKGASGTY